MFCPVSYAVVTAPELPKMAVPDLGKMRPEENLAKRSLILSSRLSFFLFSISSLAYFHFHFLGTPFRRCAQSNGPHGPLYKFSIVRNQKKSP